jgi:hypothetical protein
MQSSWVDNCSIFEEEFFTDVPIVVFDDFLPLDFLPTRLKL